MGKIHLFRSLNAVVFRLANHRKSDLLCARNTSGINGFGGVKENAITQQKSTHSEAEWVLKFITRLFLYNKENIVQRIQIFEVVLMIFFVQGQQ